MSHLPARFGPYEPVQRLGAGGMAETFVAVRRGPAGFEQRVCIKRILPAYEADRDFVEAFLREARTSAQLRHANIVQVLDFGLADDSHYLALELIDGIDLRALLRRRSKSPALDPELVTLIAADLALALDHAHGGGQAREAIVHRDISPSNVLASRAGEIKLTDFGIARAIGGAQHTATGVIKGKVPYLPPEYIEHGNFEARSDLFSLGVMLHELLTGRRPFDGDSDLDTVRRIISGERAALRTLAPEAPDALLRCIDLLLESQPAQRPASARAVLDALPQISAHQVRMRLGELVQRELGEIATDPAARFVAAPPPSPRRPRREEPTRTLPILDDADEAAEIAAAEVAELDERERAAEAGRERQRTRRAPRTTFVLGGLTFIVVFAAVATWLRPAPAPRASGQAPRPTLPVDYIQQVRQQLAAQKAPSAAPPTAPVALAPPAPSHAQVELHIVVTPFGDVWIDGKARGHAPLTLKLKPGKHDFAWGDGRPEEEGSFKVEPGQDNLVLRRRVD
jgi:hypothetical protein